MPIEIRKKAPTKGIFDGVRSLTRNEVLVGVPAENAGRQPEPGEERTLNYAEIGYLNEFGGTGKLFGHEVTIPPRPHLRPGVADAKDEIAKHLKAGAMGALRGDKDAAERALGRAGLAGQMGVQNKISNGPFAPLAPYTLKKRKAKGRTGEAPLIDTGIYRSARITYVVRPKGED